MTSQIKGYRELTQDEIELINEIKDLGASIQQLHSKVQSSVNTQIMKSCGPEVDRLNQATPGRFVSLAKTDFQTALMYLTRAVAQPTNF